MLKFLAQRLGIKVTRDNDTCREDLTMLKARLKEARRAAGSSSAEKEKYERAFNSAVGAARTLLTHGSPPRAYFSRGVDLTRARLENGEFADGTFEDVVVALYHEIVFAHLERNNRQDDDMTSHLASSIRVSMWPTHRSMNGTCDLDDALEDASLPEERWTSACSRFRRTSSPVPGSGSSSSTWPTAPT